MDRDLYLNVLTVGNKNAFFYPGNYMAISNVEILKCLIIIIQMCKTRIYLYYVIVFVVFPGIFSDLSAE